MHQVHEYPHLNINYIGYIELQIVLMHRMQLTYVSCFFSARNKGICSIYSIIIFHSSAGMYGPKLRKT